MLQQRDTVTNVAAFSFQFLAQRPDIQAIIAEHPDRIPDVVDECLRLFGVISTPRLVVRECTRFGVTFRPGEMVLCVLAMGGRDARRHADPAGVLVTVVQKVPLSNPLTLLM